MRISAAAYSLICIAVLMFALMFSFAETTNVLNVDPPPISRLGLNPQASDLITLIENGDADLEAILSALDKQNYLPDYWVKAYNSSNGNTKHLIQLLLFAYRNHLHSLSEVSMMELDSLEMDRWIGNEYHFPRNEFTPQGNFLKYVFIEDNGYQLVWGNRFHTFKTNDTLGILPQGVVGITYSSENAIIVENSCGSPCWFGYVLPLQKNAREHYMDYPLACDTLRHRIAYASATFFKNNHILLEVLNYSSGQQQTIKLDACEDIATWAGQIDSINFENDSIYIEWQGKSCTPENSWEPKNAKRFALKF